MTRVARRHRQITERVDGSQGSPLELAALVSGGIGLAAALWWLTGPPQMPSNWPDWARVGEILTASHVDYGGVTGVATGLGWLVLGYLALTIAIRAVGRALVSVSDGAGWARTTLRLSDFVTIPVVRRVVDGGLAGIVVGAIWLRGGAAEALVPTDDHRTILSASIGPHLVDSIAHVAPIESVNGQASANRGGVVSYTVVAGDNLWDISRRFYGDGTLYTAIFRANEGRVMATGEPFINPRVIRPGWVLDVPLPAHHAWPAGDHVMYRVRPDDSLWRISESFLGGGLRWMEIWDLNKGRDMGGGQEFSNPSDIFPGWVLDLPVAVTAATTDSLREPQMMASPPTPSSPTLVPSMPSDPEVVSPSAPADAPISEPLGDAAGDPHSFRVPTATILAAAAGLAISGAAVLTVRQVAHRSGRPARRAARVHGRGKAPGRGDVGRVVLAARALTRGLAEFGFDDLRLVLICESERFMEFTLNCAPGDAEAVAGSRYDLARRLACAVNAEAMTPTRVRIKLSRFQRLAGLLMDDQTATARLLLVPVGATESGVYYLNLAAVGNVAISGNKHAAWKLVSAWLATLSAVHGPKELAFLLGGSGLELEVLQSDPHFAADTGRNRERSVDEIAAEIEETILAREAPSAPQGTTVDIVAIAALSDEHQAEVERLETSLRRGPGQAISTICLGDRVDDSINVFGARVALAEQGAGPGEWALSLGRDTPLIFKPIEVRSDVLRPHVRLEAPGDHDNHSAAAERDETAANHVGDTETDEEVVLPEAPLEENTGAQAEDITGLPEATAPEDPPANASSTLVSRQATLLPANDEGTEVETVEATGPLIAVRTFGSFEVTAGGQEITGWNIQKARELLAYLIARGGTRVLRDEAAEALWPDEGLAQVEHLLSNAAHYLRRTIKAALPTPDVQVLLISDQKYRLLPGLFRVDVDAFEAHLRRGESLEGADALVEYERALAVYKGDFLGNEPYEWADAYRREYQRRFAAAAREAARLALDCRDTRKALEFYGAMLARDPIDEEATRGLMRCHAKLGDTNGVRRVYKRLVESLRRELEDEKAEPVPETTTLFRELTADSVGRQASRLPD